ncbi:MAG: gamma-glutamylcyclotransferase family protein [Myxococcota bacterium]|nr:gamma-glutamylcyclotransferase family protein [Myxococcota bacterium]
MSTEPLFVYGTLLFPEVLEAVADQRPRLEPAVLPGYARRGLRERVYPAIVPRSGEQVAGRLVHGLDDRGRERIDRFEGDLYRRLRVEVRVGDARLLAFAYVLHPDRTGELLEASWDPEAFQLAHGPAYLERCRVFGRTGAW